MDDDLDDMYVHPFNEPDRGFFSGLDGAPLVIAYLGWVMSHYVGGVQHISTKWESSSWLITVKAPGCQDAFFRVCFEDLIYGLLMAQAWYILCGYKPWLPLQPGWTGYVAYAWQKYAPDMSGEMVGGRRCLTPDEITTVLPRMVEKNVRRRKLMRDTPSLDRDLQARQAHQGSHRHLNTQAELENPNVHTRLPPPPPRPTTTSMKAEVQVPQACRYIPIKTQDLKDWRDRISGIFIHIPANLGTRPIADYIIDPSPDCPDGVLHDSLVRTPFASMVVFYNLLRYVADVTRGMAYSISGTLSDNATPSAVLLNTFLPIFKCLMAPSAPQHLWLRGQLFTFDKLEYLVGRLGPDAGQFLLALARDYCFASFLDLKLDIALYENTDALAKYAIFGRGVHMMLGVGGDTLRFDDQSCMGGDTADASRLLYNKCAAIAEEQWG